jgi:tetratricopeptide (TPR) repeat protein
MFVSNSYTIRAAALNYLGQYPQAIKDATTAIHLNPSNDVAWNTRSYSFCRLQRYDLAWKDADEVRSLFLFFFVCFFPSLNLNPSFFPFPFSHRPLKSTPRTIPLMATARQHISVLESCKWSVRSVLTAKLTSLHLSRLSSCLLSVIFCPGRV